MKKKVNNIYIYISIAVLIFLLSLLPILYASLYTHPVMDDFSFSKEVHVALQTGEGLGGALRASFAKVADVYMDWQGTYSAIFLFSMQPGVFSQNLYFLTTVVMVFSLCFSTLFFVDTLFVKCFKSTHAYSVLVSTVILFCTFQFVVNIPEAFFWWNGSVYYTFFYSLALCFLAVLVRMILTENKKHRNFFFALELFLAFVLGGGNYSTGLSLLCIFALALIFLTRSKVADLYKFYVIFAVLLICFAINMAAPGNEVRASHFQGCSPVKAVILSIIHAFKYIGSWTRLPQVVMLAFISPILYDIARKLDFEFKYPLIAIVLSFLLFATQLTPPLYAMQMVGAGRQVNIYYYSYYLLSVFWVFYISGYLAKRNIVNINIQALFDVKLTVSATALLVLLFVSGCYGYGLENMASVKVWNGVDSGEAWQYEVEYMELVEKVQNGEKHISDVRTCPINVFYPIMFSEGYAGAVADYYGVEPFEVIPLTE